MERINQLKDAIARAKTPGQAAALRKEYWQQMRAWAEGSGNEGLARGYDLSRRVADLDNQIWAARNRGDNAAVTSLQQQKNEVMEQGRIQREKIGRVQDPYYSGGRAWNPAAAAARRTV